MKSASLLTVPSSISTYSEGQIKFAGYDLRELVEKSHYEEVVFLLWNRRLPSKLELESFKNDLNQSQCLSTEAVKGMGALSSSAPIMDKLRTALSFLGCIDPDRDDNGAASNIRKGLRLVAQMPELISILFQGNQKDSRAVSVSEGDSVAARFLHLIHGKKLSSDEIKIFDQAMMVHAEKEFNISTYAARLAASSDADLHSCVTAAISTLKGALHGGANLKVIEMLKKMQSSTQCETFIDDVLKRKEKIFGFGHLIYKDGDPRSLILKALCQKLARLKNNSQLFEMAEEVETLMKRKKALLSNVDFYSAVLYSDLGIPEGLFPAVFAMSRMAGWIAHIMEQLGRPQILVPRAEYIGIQDAKYPTSS
ncbi:MAG: citrate synthase [Bacteriovoracaceae bacterium]|nr:citrate synthase [Bacteriovoracaceae bacterium]